MFRIKHPAGPPVGSSLAQRLKSKQPTMDPEDAAWAAKELLAFSERSLQGLVKKPGMDLEAVSEQAKVAWEATLKQNPKGELIDVFTMGIDWAKERGFDVHAAALLLPPAQIRWLWGAVWYSLGKPRVRWSNPKYPELLMASHIHSNVAEVVKAPWPAFWIDLPPGLYTKDLKDPNTRRELKSVIAHCHKIPEDVDHPRAKPGDDVWNIMVQGDNSIELWRHGVPTADLVTMASEEYHSKLFEGSVQDEDDRILVLIGRLIVGTCLSMSDPSKILHRGVSEGRKQRAKLSRSNKRYKPLPLTEDFVVGAPVTLDVREVLRGFIEHGSSRKGSAPSARRFIYGHWKLQPHGPKNSLRKLIHREGFWTPRDPNLPIRTSEHVVKG